MIRDHRSRSTGTPRRVCAVPVICWLKLRDFFSGEPMPAKRSAIRKIKDVLRLSYLASIPLVCSIFGSFCGGYASDRLIVRGMPIVQARKLPAALGYLGSAVTAYRRARAPVPGEPPAGARRRSKNPKSYFMKLTSQILSLTSLMPTLCPANT
jgi:hypothetical protein